MRTQFHFGAAALTLVDGTLADAAGGFEAIASSDDNYLSMSGPYASFLRGVAGSDYVHAARAHSPVAAGEIVATEPYGLVTDYPQLTCVLHGAVVDYDTTEASPEELVEAVTRRVLDEARRRGLGSVLLPTFAAGSGGISMPACARAMCRALRSHYGRHQAPARVSILLYKPAQDGEAERRREFTQEVNLQLGVPPDPLARSVPPTEVMARDDAVARLHAVLDEEVPDRRHVELLGGPRTGKRTLLRQAFLQRRRRPPTGSALERSVYITLGDLHTDTPLWLTLRKLLHVLAEQEEDEAKHRLLRSAFATANEGDVDLVALFREVGYDRVVIFVEEIRRLLRIDRATADGVPVVQAFFAQVHALSARLRLVFTMRYDSDRDRLGGMLTSEMRGTVESVRLATLSDRRREAWAEAQFDRYLARAPTAAEMRFVAQEGGRHPFTIALALHELLKEIKRDEILYLRRPDTIVTPARQLHRRAAAALDETRRHFLDTLYGALRTAEQEHLALLVQAVLRERELGSLVGRTVANTATGADRTRLTELRQQPDPRDALVAEVLARLVHSGALVSPDGADGHHSFAVEALEDYVARAAGLKQQPGTASGLRNVSITITEPKRGEIQTDFRRGQGRTLRSRPKAVRKRRIDEFWQDLRGLLMEQSGAGSPRPSSFRNFEEAGRRILTQFMTGKIAEYLYAGTGTLRLSIDIDETLAQVPWELMLEGRYTGAIPHQVGRSVISQQDDSAFGAPVSGGNPIRSLLIADPADDLPHARQEVAWLASRLAGHAAFATPVVREGSAQCRAGALLDELGRGTFGLVHYAGHSTQQQEQSGWQLAGGDRITTTELTSALKAKPPQLVVSSSCESGAPGEIRPVAREDQTFDLPGAFLQAGVPYYVGTLWKVNSNAAGRFARTFYDAFLARHPLGACMQQAKESMRNDASPMDWLAYVLYGAPQRTPQSIFPALRR